MAIYIKKTIKKELPDLLLWWKCNQLEFDSAIGATYLTDSSTYKNNSIPVPELIYATTIAGKPGFATNTGEGGPGIKPRKHLCQNIKFKGFTFSFWIFCDFDIYWLKLIEFTTDLMKLGFNMKFWLTIKYGNMTPYFNDWTNGRDEQPALPKPQANTWSQVWWTWDYPGKILRIGTNSQYWELQLSDSTANYWFSKLTDFSIRPDGWKYLTVMRDVKVWKRALSLEELQNERTEFDRI